MKHINHHEEACAAHSVTSLVQKWSRREPLTVEEQARLTEWLDFNLATQLSALLLTNADARAHRPDALEHQPNPFAEFDFRGGTFMCSRCGASETLKSKPDACSCCGNAYLSRVDTAA